MVIVYSTLLEIRRGHERKTVRFVPPYSCLRYFRGHLFEVYFSYCSFLRNQSLKCELEGYSSHRSISEMIIKKQRSASKTFQSFPTHKTIKTSTDLL